MKRTCNYYILATRKPGISTQACSCTEMISRVPHESLSGTSNCDKLLSHFPHFPSFFPHSLQFNTILYPLQFNIIYMHMYKLKRQLISTKSGRSKGTTVLVLFFLLVLKYPCFYSLRLTVLIPALAYLLFWLRFFDW